MTTTNESSGGGVAAQGAPPRRNLKETLAGVEREIILEALRHAGGNKAKAARALGISERLMGLRVKHLGIDWRSLRARRNGRPRYT